MQWTELTRHEQATVRQVRDELNKLGVATSVSQIAKFFDDVMAWQRDELTLAELTARTGFGR